jgi:hypothetical protein
VPRRSRALALTAWTAEKVLRFDLEGGLGMVAAVLRQSGDRVLRLRAWAGGFVRARESVFWEGRR